MINLNKVMMTDNYTKEQQYLKAKKRVKDIKGFYYHLGITVFVIPILIFVNLKFVPQFHWFWFATGGMTFGLFFHWLGVFGFTKLGLGKEWEEKKIREIMNEDKL